MKLSTLLWAVLAIAFVASSNAWAQATLDRVERSLREQIRGGADPAPTPAVDPGYLGITADDRQEQGRGVRVIQVVTDGPAEQGGLKVGDLVTAIDGNPIRLMDDLGRVLMPKPAGAQLTFTINREGKTQQQQVTLGERPATRGFGRPAESIPQPPAPSDASAAPAKLGVRTVLVTEAAAREHQLRDGNGAQVVSVAVGSPAERAGIPVGAVIVAVDGQAIDNPTQLTEAVQQSGAKGQIEIIYIDHAREFTKQVQLSAAPAGPPNLQLRGRPPQPPMPMAEDAPTLPAPSELGRIAELEAIVRQLEARIEKLEARLSKE